MPWPAAQGSRCWGRRRAGCDDWRMRVLIPLPDRDFDVTEVAVPWRVLGDAGHQVVFATEQAGTVPAADPRLLDGVLFGQMGAAPTAKGCYAELSRAGEFTATAGWAGLDPAGFDGLLLPGGHAPATPPGAVSWRAARPPACPNTWNARPT